MLPQEKSIVEQSRFQHVLGYIRRLGRASGFGKLPAILRMYGLDPANAKTATKLAPLGKDVGTTAAKALGPAGHISAQR
jgi:hypothetical protein